MSDNAISIAQNMIESAEFRRRIDALLPRRTITPERFIRLAVGVLRQSPDLALDQLGLARCLLECAVLGLEPNTPLGQAYILPYGRRATLVIGYKGYIILATRSELQIDVPQLVYRGDEFSYVLGTEPRIIHRVKYRDEAPSVDDITHAYVVARPREGAPLIEVMERWKMDKRRARSPAEQKGRHSAWQSDPEAMYRRLPIRGIANYLPMATDIAIAAEIEAAHEDERPSPLLEASLDLSSLAPADKGQRVEALAREVESLRSRDRRGVPAHGGVAPSGDIDPVPEAQ